MPGFLGNLSVDRTSFWYGFLTGALFLFLFALIRPFLARLWQAFTSRVQDVRASLTTSAETRLRREMILLAQHNHLAAPLFSLDEVVIPPRLLMLPRLLALPRRSEPIGESQPGEESSFDLPYLPDWPELAAHYGAEILTLPQALSGGASLALLGGAGCGKSVALAHLTCLIARRDPSVGKLGTLLPVFVHLADLLPAGQYTGQPLELIERAILSCTPALTSSRLTELLRAVFQHGRALLLLDGLDEQPQALHLETIKFLGELLKTFPGTRMVVASRLDDFSGLPALGLIPVALAAWNRRQQQEFLVRWGTNWRKFIEPPTGPGSAVMDPALINSWLLVDSSFLTPLQLTLKAWAAYAGDTKGPSPANNMNAYIRRMTAGLPKARPALESLALQMVLTLHPTLTQKEARKWTGEAELTGEPVAEESPPENGKPTALKTQTARLRGMASELVEAGILITHAEGRLSFAHPSLTGYLAAAAIVENGLTQALAAQPKWTGKSATCAWLATMSDSTTLVDKVLDSGPDPLLNGLLTTARWLPLTSKATAWRETVLQLLLEVLRSEDWVFSLRVRALVALLRSGDPALGTIFRQMLSSPVENSRLLAALGAGFLCEPQVTAALSDALEDPSPWVKWAASLALATIGTQSALENLAYALLHGDDGTRRSAAEALALHPAEGYAVLQEGSEVEDLLVRRAVVFGLAKVRQPWARQILEKMAVDDKEWVVRAASALALERLQAPPVYIPTPARGLSETPWLIAFAGERGMGLSPGKPAMKLLLLALQEGNPGQRLAALQTLESVMEPRALPLIYAIIAEADGEISQAAFHTLWMMAGAGVDVRNPVSA